MAYYLSILLPAIKINSIEENEIFNSIEKYLGFPK